MQNFRFTVVEKANAKKPIVTTAPDSETSSYYGSKVFNRAAMRKYLSEDTRRSIYETIERGATLDRDVANHVAEGMKRWAMDNGATHYTHWFQPLTGGTLPPLLHTGGIPPEDPLPPPLRPADGPVSPKTAGTRCYFLLTRKALRRRCATGLPPA